MKNILLYLVTIVIWGSTWIGIKYQLGSVDPLVSVIYRFGLSSTLLMSFCCILRLNLRFSLKDHVFMGLLGIFLFSMNYWLVYIAETYLTSGLVAVLFSSIVFLNIANGYIFLHTPVDGKMILGGVLGIIGIFLIFLPEIEAFYQTGRGVQGIVFGFFSVLLASFGNIISARNSKHHIPVLQANAFGMGYGTMLLIIMALVLGREFTFSHTIEYVGSLFYLAVFGSIIAFGSYLTLIGSIGADKASYTIMVTPVVALVISSFLEGYCWSCFTVFGMTLVVAGNFLALYKKSSARP